MTAAKMGAQALRWPPLLLVLLTVLLGHSPGATAQTQVCSVDKTFLQVQENANITEALVNISVPEGQQVTLGSSSTPSAFRILGNQLFLSVIPDYEVQAVAWVGCFQGPLRVHTASLEKTWGWQGLCLPQALTDPSGPILGWASSIREQSCLVPPPPPLTYHQ
ncbi:Hypothetical predicted protein [Marmota monax]|uniref:Uncharacterized protein n=1 Tax=Marmota monax TaxID=9995 RepID=A0A5E4AXA5_MARMO|nr:hypothetical protein GHT09_015182 [Marmota monax]VTJ61142.1 Hypothetical predicted protein [Marmota monax]